MHWFRVATDLRLITQCVVTVSSWSWVALVLQKSNNHSSSASGNNCSVNASTVCVCVPATLGLQNGLHLPPGWSSISWILGKRYTLFPCLEVLIPTGCWPISQPRLVLAHAPNLQSLSWIWEIKYLRCVDQITVNNIQYPQNSFFLIHLIK